MFPRKKIADGLHRDAAVLPLIGQHTKRRRKKGIVTKLIDANFRCDHWQCGNVSKPGRLISIQEIDKRSIESPHRRGKQQITKIPTIGAPSLEEKNQEQLRNKRPRRHGCDDHKQDPMCAL